MATEVRQFAVTVPAGTAQATPYTKDVSFPTRIVERIDWRVPPGPRGVMGFRLASGGNPVLPTNDGAYIVADDDRATWLLSGLIESGAWQVQGYNTGAYAHTVYLTFHLSLPGAKSVATQIGVPLLGIIEV